MRMNRRLRLLPKPRSSGCVAVSPRLDPVKGLYPLRKEFNDSRLLLKLSPTWAPVAKPCWTPALARVVLVMSEFVPVVTTLVSGVVWWVQLSCPTIDGSKIGTGVPLDCRMVPCIDRLSCGSPSTPRSRALVAPEDPAVARPDVAGLVTTGLSGPPTPTGTSASV